MNYPADSLGPLPLTRRSHGEQPLDHRYLAKTTVRIHVGPSPEAAEVYAPYPPPWKKQRLTVKSHKRGV
ncbi:unnamed protein product [Tuber melanosporum]|uniref:(Perigord truffle) hypothetical protein n=1 Tax=Tuber melanosporum (strain Mel28) TaxID=656061 RepID=D5GGX6_TUBMM|nr:uncharacterized protein GSTUM_00007601001 [Tuber melanosporum]CAZ83769.1 unnamed protein product [Tuber melanosporum]